MGNDTTRVRGKVTNRLFSMETTTLFDFGGRGKRNFISKKKGDQTELWKENKWEVRSTYINALINIERNRAIINYNEIEEKEKKRNKNVMHILGERLLRFIFIMSSNKAKQKKDLKIKYLNCAIININKRRRKSLKCINFYCYESF